MSCYYCGSTSDYATDISLLTILFEKEPNPIDSATEGLELLPCCEDHKLPRNGDSDILMFIISNSAFGRIATYDALFGDKKSHRNLRYEIISRVIEKYHLERYRCRSDDELSYEALVEDVRSNYEHILDRIAKALWYSEYGSPFSGVSHLIVSGIYNPERSIDNIQIEILEEKLFNIQLETDFKTVKSDVFKYKLMEIDENTIDLVLIFFNFFMIIFRMHN